MGNVSFDFEGRTVIVTGAARGVGRAIGEHFRHAGAAVYIVDVDAEAVGQAAKELGANGVAADVCDTGQVTAVVERVMSETGRIDVLVNNAGILRDGVVWKLSDDDYEAVSEFSPDGVIFAADAFPWTSVRGPTGPGGAAPLIGFGSLGSQPPDARSYTIELTGTNLPEPGRAAGWIAGAAFIIVILALIFAGGEGTRTTGTDASPPATTGVAPAPPAAPTIPPGQRP